MKFVSTLFIAALATLTVATPIRSKGVKRDVAPIKRINRVFNGLSQIQLPPVNTSLPSTPNPPNAPCETKCPNSYTGNGTFQQILDHSNPSAGTFSQWYMWSTQYWDGPGSPVILFCPGETNASAYGPFMTNEALMGALAQDVGGAVIILEHRYWGNSSPFEELTTANLQHLTSQNAIADFVNFANNVKLPFDSSGRSNAAKAPWILTGGSYSGALTAWTESVAPGTFWAYHASSAPVQANSNNYGYFTPILQGMPQNCSTDLNLVIPYMDSVLNSQNITAIQALKAQFGMGSILHNDDFMAALENGPWLWQENQYFSTGGFYTFCDYIENAATLPGSLTPPGAAGVGLQKALSGYAAWAQYYLPNYCEEVYGYFPAGSYACFDTYNVNNPIYSDISIANVAERQWQWILCNEPFGFYQTGSPVGQPTLASRLSTTAYWQRQCANMFPTGPNGETYGAAQGKTNAAYNAYTLGWNNENSTRLQYTNGGLDPWREVGVSSDYRPGGPMNSTTQIPVHIMPGGFHCSDLYIASGSYNAGAKTVIQAGIQQLINWVNEYPGFGTDGK